MEKIRIVIADDQILITQSFKIVLETLAEGISVVGLAHDGREAVALAQKERPDVILMDVRMPNVDGVEATRLIHQANINVKIIMLTTFDDDNYVTEAIRAGAVGYLLKDISTDELINSIRSVSHGTVLVSATVARKMFHTEPGKRDEDAIDILGTLNRRELEILRRLVQGSENKEIASELSIAEQTVKNNISVIYTKLGVSNRKEAKRLALKTGLISPQDIIRNL